MSIRGIYADSNQMEEEIIFCKQLYRQHPEWMVIDMTNKSVEEASLEILRRMARR